MRRDFNEPLNKMRLLYKNLTFSIISVFIVSGCTTQIPKEAFQLSPESLELRQLQTRRFDTNDEISLLSAGAAVLQDIGFTIDESETKLGVIVASKDRSAVEAGQVIVAIIAAFFGAQSSIDKEQKMRVSFITSPYGANNKSYLVRITFQRIVWNTQGQVTRHESLDDPIFYQEFFQIFSKAVFLEAHEI